MTYSASFADIRDIVAAACLCHDMGNPPFGHGGEKTISAFFREGAGRKFRDMLYGTPVGRSDQLRGERQFIPTPYPRVQGTSTRRNGHDLQYARFYREVSVLFPSLRKQRKVRIFESEEEIYRRVAAQLGIPELSPGIFARHPLVYIMEAADDICYQIMDLEDAHKLKK